MLNVEIIERIKIKVRVTGNTESGLSLQDEKGETYHWFSKSYSSPLFYATNDEWFTISAGLFIYDNPTPKKGLKNVRVLKS